MSGIPFCYVVGSMYQSSSAAQTGMLVLAILVSGILVLCMLVLSFFDGLHTGIFWAKMGLRVFPPYAFGEVFTNLLVKSSALAFGEPKTTWDMQVGQSDRGCPRA